MRELITFAGRCLEGGNLDQAAASYGDALALWRGRPFTGLDRGDLATTADLIEQEYVSALEESIDVLRQMWAADQRGGVYGRGHQAGVHGGQARARARA